MHLRPWVYILTYVCICNYVHTYISSSTVAFNSRDQPKNIYGFQKEWTYINNGIKVRIRKTYLDTVTIALTMIYLH